MGLSCSGNCDSKVNVHDQIYDQPAGNPQPRDGFIVSIDEAAKKYFVPKGDEADVRADAESDASWPIAPMREQEEVALNELHSYKILDTKRTPTFEILTELARLHLGAPVSLISFVDDSRQWWKSSPGMEDLLGSTDMRELPRSEGFCQWVVASANGNPNPIEDTIEQNDQDTDAIIILDAATDPRVGANPGYTKLGIRFYAGVPMYSESGAPLGSFCVLDTRPRKDFPEVSIRCLKRLAILAMREVFLQDRHRKVIDAMKSAEEEARSKVTSVAILSHEIRNALQTISYVAATFDEVEQNHPSQPNSSGKSSFSAVEVLQTCSNHLLGVVNDFLDFSKIEDNSFELEQISFDLNDILRQVLLIQSVHADAKKVSIAFTPDPNVPTRLIGDPIRIRQIMLNLTSNATKYTESGGQIKIQPSYDHPSEILRLDVKDNGKGIAAECRERIFTPFKQEDANTSRLFGGTGIGLYLSRKLARKMKGDVSVHSELGKGSTFVLTLRAPISTSNLNLTDAVKVQSPCTTQRRVFVVEDSLINQKMVIKMIEKMKQITAKVVDVSGDSKDCLERLTHSDPDGRPLYDVILMDYNMPGLNGIETMNRIRNDKEYSAYKSVPVICISGETSDEFKAECSRAGFMETLTKPILPENLERAISNIKPS